MMKKQPQFSYYKEPVKNVVPYKTISMADVYRALTSNYLKERTHQLRLISGKAENRVFKASKFPYVTFSGIFSKRNEKSLMKHSGLIALDFDHVENVEALKTSLLIDPCLETELLFISPNGNGIKWIVSIELTKKYTHAKMFQAISTYIYKTYSIEVDNACKDVSRATFLCYDPEAYINPKYLVK
ncbi:MAG: virulence protein E [Bacteroidetes bacterium]|nr:virulence protein E [Bacteroidota bacterium]